MVRHRSATPSSSVQIRLAPPKRKITQTELANVLNVKQETISAYESGKALPSCEALIKMAEYLNTSTDYLLGRIEEDSPLTGFNFKDMNPKTYKLQTRRK